MGLTAAEFAKRFPDAGILVTGVEEPDTRAHGANESLHLGEFAFVGQHDLGVAADIADRIAVLYGRELLDHGLRREVAHVLR